jgi:hypothetical protein
MVVWLAIDETALKESLVTGIQDAAGNAFAYTVNGGNIEQSCVLGLLNSHVC